MLEFLRSSNCPIIKLFLRSSKAPSQNRSSSEPHLANNKLLIFLKNITPSITIIVKSRGSAFRILTQFAFCVTHTFVVADPDLATFVHTIIAGFYGPICKYCSAETELEEDVAELEEDVAELEEDAAELPNKQHLESE